MSARRSSRHPGWTCCDLSQDLAGWIARQRAAFANVRLRAGVLHAEGARLNVESIRATVEGNRDRATEAAARCHVAHGAANAVMQSVLVREGHVDRVEAAHAWRLSVTTYSPSPRDLGNSRDRVDERKVMELMAPAQQGADAMTGRPMWTGQQSGDAHMFGGAGARMGTPGENICTLSPDLTQARPDANRGAVSPT